MRILITGGCGFLGSHLVEHFLKHTDADIVVLDKLNYASAGFDRLRDVRSNMGNGVGAQEFTRRVLMLGCDLSQPVPAGIVREIGQVDYVIHAAAESHVDKSIVDPLPFLESNVMGTHNLLMMVRFMGTAVKRVFLVSTDEVYGPAPMMGHGTFGAPAVEALIEMASNILDMTSKLGVRDFLRKYDGDGSPGDATQAECFQAETKRFWELRKEVLFAGYDEHARFRPANPYAASKAGAEAIAMAYANTYRLPITIVNTMNLIGERQHPEKFVPMVIGRALRRELVQIHADPTCKISGTRYYLHCRTYAHALHWLMQYEGLLPLKLHVCGEREISNVDLAQLIAGYVGNPLIYELVDFHSSRPGHDLRYAMSDHAIRKMGWVRPMNLEESLKNTVAWYLRHREWLDLS